MQFKKNQCFTGSFIAGAIAIIWLLSSPLAKAETDFSDLDQSKNQPAFHIAFLPYEAERFGFLTPNDYLLFVESYNLTGENFLADLTNFTWLYITLLWPDFGYLKYKRQLNDWDNLNDQMGPPSNEHEAKVRNKVLSLYHDRWKNYPFLSRERLTVSGVFLAYTVLVNVSFRRACIAQTDSSLF